MLRKMIMFVAAAQPLALAHGFSQAQGSDRGAEEPDQEAAQDVHRVDLRVSLTKSGGLVVVDRGSDALLKAGDLVLFHARDGNIYQGTVVELAGRSAGVQLQSTAPELESGTRGEVLIPRSRLPQRSKPQPDVTEHAPWANADEDWTQGMPLLAEVGSIPPEQRERRVTARAYAIGDMTYTSEDSNSDYFFRQGADVELENFWGRGGRAHADFEFNQRMTDVEDGEDEGFSKLRIDRLSYASGGTRFEPEGWEAGRFLLRGMPEFGVIDGGEWGRRRENGDRYGVSAGWMPEPDEDFDSGGDFQISGWYRWVHDASERLSADAGFQKTWHNGRADRDLIVTKLRYLPLVGWNFLGTTWVDLYTDGDEAKGSGPELTRALLTTGHRWEAGHALNVNFSHNAFPELRRFEFTPVQEDQLADDRVERLSVSGWRQVNERQRMHAELGGWNDEDESGGDVEVGVDVRDLSSDRDRGDLTVFNTLGEFTKVFGARVSYARYTALGRWDAMYEIARHDTEGFDEDNLLQHRLRGSHDFRILSDLDISIYGQGLFWDDEQSWSIGFYLQKSF